MYKRFKTWVADAWEDLQQGNTDWGLTVSRSSTTLHPRLVVRFVDGIISIDDTIVDAEGNLIGTIVGTSPCAGGLTFVDLDQIEETPLLGEVLTTSSGAILTFVYQGQYSLYELASDLDDLNYNSVYTTDENQVQQKIKYVPWASYDNYQYTAYPNNYSSAPFAYTLNAQHMFEVMPPLSAPIVVSFSYIKNVYSLVNWDDTPLQLPSRFHDLIAWMAVSKYADYDNNSQLWSKADKNVHAAYVKADMAVGTQPTIGGWNE